MHNYEKKTGNYFGRGLFKKIPGKYFHHAIDFNLSKQTPNTAIPSKLSDPIYQLMQMLFDLKHVQNMKISCDLDVKQLPLGKISPEQIQDAMIVLSEISNKIKLNSSLAQMRNSSNKFYTLIPHGFGVKRPPIIDSIETVNEKNGMLEDLLNMNLIYEFFDGNNDKCNPLDACYYKMKTRIEPVNKYSDVYLKIWSVVKNTHGPTHDTFTYEVVEVFEVKRDEQEDRFQKYAHLTNRQLLWHGSRHTNFVSILSNGLKIAPPEAPCNFK